MSPWFARTSVDAGLRCPEISHRFLLSSKIASCSELKKHCHQVKHDFENLKNIYRSLEAERNKFYFVEQYSTND